MHLQLRAPALPTKNLVNPAVMLQNSVCPTPLLRVFYPRFCTDRVSIRRCVLIRRGDTPTFGRWVLPDGEERPQWFKRLPGRWTPSQDQPHQAFVAQEAATTLNGGLQLKSGWILVSPIRQVSCAPEAPGLPVDFLETHKQAKIKFSTADDGKRARGGQCKLCCKHGLKQKKPAYLCTECGDFYCHNVKGQARGCFWSHICYKFVDSGVPSAAWMTAFRMWDHERVHRCADWDGIELGLDSD
jgi:hypothetical protein